MRGRVEALLTARAATHLASLQVGMTQENILPGDRESVRGRVEALLTAHAAAHLASLQVGMTHENILPGERARPRRSFAHSARRRSLGLFAGRNDARKYFTRRACTAA